MSSAIIMLMASACAVVEGFVGAMRTFDPDSDHEALLKTYSYHLRVLLAFIMSVLAIVDVHVLLILLFFPRTTDEYRPLNAPPAYIAAVMFANVSLLFMLYAIYRATGWYNETLAIANMGSLCLSSTGLLIKQFESSPWEYDPMYKGRWNHPTVSRMHVVEAWLLIVLVVLGATNVILVEMKIPSVLEQYTNLILGWIHIVLSVDNAYDAVAVVFTPRRHKNQEEDYEYMKDTA
jgi:hypothetical protein